MKATTRMLTGAAFAIALAGAAAAQGRDACEGSPGGGAVKLVVEVNSLQSSDGEVAVTVYPDDASRFLARGGKLLRERTAASAPVTRACFWLPPGFYGVAVYHDANGNHDFDRDLIGRPLEGYGFSNDATGRMGLPPFRAVRFRLPAGGGSIKLRMRYLR
jgi:uncharacterized protein (DUF2141 family)